MGDVLGQLGDRRPDDVSLGARGATHAARAPVTPEVAGNAVLELLRADLDTVALAYLLTGAGFKELA
jgi:hypothetical protein